MIDALDKHIDALIEAYKNNRRKDSDSKGMYYIRRLLKGEYNENHQSVFSSNQKRPHGDTAMDVQQSSDSINQRN